MTRPKRKSRWKHVSGLFATIAITAGSVALASNIKTTEQKAAEAEPPPPTVITSSVRTGQLADTVPLQCAPGFKSQTTVTDDAEGERVITAGFLSEGDIVGDGTLLTEINGEPLFALTGGFPLYRDLKLGDIGPDALMLNSALMRAGLLHEQMEPAASTVTDATRLAISYLYSYAGYDAPKPASPEDKSIPHDSLKFIPEGGVVIERPAKIGKIGSDPLLTLGVGGRGLMCSTASGDFPAEAQLGQELIVPSLNSAVYTVDLVELDSEESVPVSGDASIGIIPPESPTLSVAEKFIFAAAGEAINGITGSLPATLVLEKSEPDGLIVPSSALWTKDGSTMVTVADNNITRDVQVTVLFTSAGENTVSVPVGDLLAGDQVLVVGTGQ